MAEKKCVYTIILLSMCVQLDPDQNFSLKCGQAFSLSIFPFSPPQPTFLFLTASQPSSHLSGSPLSTVTEEADQIATAIAWLVSPSECI